MNKLKNIGICVASAAATYLAIAIVIYSFEISRRETSLADKKNKYAKALEWEGVLRSGASYTTTRYNTPCDLVCQQLIKDAAIKARKAEIDYEVLLMVLNQKKTLKYFLTCPIQK